MPEQKQEPVVQMNTRTKEPSFQRKRVNKLVRDRIPELMEARGQSCTTEELSPDDYLTMLEAKLDEECLSQEAYIGRIGRLVRGHGCFGESPRSYMERAVPDPKGTGRKIWRFLGEDTSLGSD